MTDIMPLTQALQEAFRPYSRSFYEVLAHDTVATTLHGGRYYISKGTPVYFAQQDVGGRRLQTRWNEAIIFPAKPGADVGEVETQRPVLHISPYSSGCVVSNDHDAMLLYASIGQADRRPPKLRGIVTAMGL